MIVYFSFETVSIPDNALTVIEIQLRAVLSGNFIEETI